MYFSLYFLVALIFGGSCRRKLPKRGKTVNVRLNREDANFSTTPQVDHFSWTNFERIICRPAKIILSSFAQQKRSKEGISVQEITREGKQARECVCRKSEPKRFLLARPLILHPRLVVMCEGSFTKIDSRTAKD